MGKNDWDLDRLEWKKSIIEWARNRQNGAREWVPIKKLRRKKHQEVESKIVMNYTSIRCLVRVRCFFFRGHCAVDDYLCESMAIFIMNWNVNESQFPFFVRFLFVHPKSIIIQSTNRSNMVNNCKWTARTDLRIN